MKINKLMTGTILSGFLAATSVFAADEELIIFDWSGYEDEGFFPAYVEKHGAAPTYAFFGDEEEAFQK